MQRIIHLLTLASLGLLGQFSYAQVTVDTYEGMDSIIIDDGLIQGADYCLYGAHFNGENIYKISPDGTVALFATGFVSPNGLAFDSDGNLFVADHLGNKINKISPAGVVSTHVEPINKPSGLLKMNDSDTLIATRYAANLILKIAPDGHIDTLSEGGILDGPVGLAFDADGNLFTANFNNRKLIQIYMDGTQEELAQFPGPGWLGFMTYGNGQFYGTGYDSNKIFQIRQSDTLITLLAGSTAGEVDGDTSIATFNRPNGITLNASNDTLFISAYTTGNVRRITGFNSAANIQNNALSLLEFSIYPNPVLNEVNITFELKGNTALKMRLLDQTGAVIRTENQQGQSGTNRINWSLEQLSEGTYFIELTTQEQTYYKQLIKSH